MRDLTDNGTVEPPDHNVRNYAGCDGDVHRADIIQNAIPSGELLLDRILDVSGADCVYSRPTGILAGILAAYVGFVVFGWIRLSGVVILKGIRALRKTA